MSPTVKGKLLIFFACPDLTNVNLFLIESEIVDDLNSSNLVEFMGAEDHNLLVFADSQARRHVRNLANMFGLDYE